MSSTANSRTPGHENDPTAREHSENPAEGGDGTDTAEIREHSQDAAEGPEES